MTLGRLYDERQNQMETLYLPVLGEKDKEPEVTGFYVLRNGKAKEIICADEERCRNKSASFRDE